MQNKTRIESICENQRHFAKKINKARCDEGRVFTSSPKWAIQHDWSKMIIFIVSFYNLCYCLLTDFCFVFLNSRKYQTLFSFLTMEKGFMHSMDIQYWIWNRDTVIAGVFLPVQAWITFYYDFQLFLESSVNFLYYVY